MNTISAVSTRPTTHVPQRRITVICGFTVATSLIIHCVTKKNRTSEIAPATARPRYSAFMILPPWVVFTKKQPMIEAMIDTAPSTKG